MLTISRLLYLVLTRLTLWLNFKAWSHQGSTQIGPTQCKCFMFLWTTRSRRWVEWRDKECDTERMMRGDTLWCNTRCFNAVIVKYCSNKALCQHNRRVRPKRTPQNIKACHHISPILTAQTGTLLIFTQPPPCAALFDEHKEAHWECWDLLLPWQTVWRKAA